MILTKAGASVYAKAKSVGVVTGCVQDSERHATVKLSELAELQHNIDRALHGENEIVMLTTDNKGNQLVTEGGVRGERA